MRAGELGAARLRDFYSRLSQLDLEVFSQGAEIEEQEKALLLLQQQQQHQQHAGAEAEEGEATATIAADGTIVVLGIGGGGGGGRLQLPRVQGGGGGGPAGGGGGGGAVAGNAGASPGRSANRDTATSLTRRNGGKDLRMAGDEKMRTLSMLAECVPRTDRGEFNKPVETKALLGFLNQTRSIDGLPPLAPTAQALVERRQEHARSISRGPPTTGSHPASRDGPLPATTTTLATHTHPTSARRPTLTHL